MSFPPYYNNATTVVPSDSTQDNLLTPAGAVHVGGAGIVDLVFPNGKTVSFTCVAGEILPYQCIRIATTSTATLMKFLFQS